MDALAAMLLTVLNTVMDHETVCTRGLIGHALVVVVAISLTVGDKGCLMSLIQLWNK